MINLLNDPALSDEIGPYAVPRTATDDVGMYDPAPEHTPPTENNTVVDMLYGPRGTLS